MGAGLDKCCSSERDRCRVPDEPGRVRFDLTEESRKPGRGVPDEFDEDASDTMTAAEKMEVLKRASKRGSRDWGTDGRKRLSVDVQDWLANSRKTGRRSEDRAQLRRGSRQASAERSPTARFSMSENSGDEHSRRSSLTRKMDSDWSKAGRGRRANSSDVSPEKRLGRSQSGSLEKRRSASRERGQSRERSVKHLLKGFRESDELSKKKQDEQESERWEAQLKITIRGAKNLRHADVGGKSDAYCTCEITGKPQTKFKTKVLESESSPQWNHVEQVKKVSNYDEFTFAVCDYVVGQDNRLGQATLAPAQWFPRGFEGQIPLVSKEKTGSASLEVRIDIIEAHPLKEKAAKKGDVDKEDVEEF
mmetsp:Transcript_123800/g.214630  ORF Transcript_123800/g.214630 Transcript_123800/m.214630 type:complete len:362 (-) Transcript_123800:59-1144(-)